jgi:hypothetical protein
MYLADIKMASDIAILDFPDQIAESIDSDFPSAILDSGPDLTQIHSLTAHQILRHMERFGRIPAEIVSLVEEGSLRLMDSDMIITQSAQLPPKTAYDNLASSDLTHSETELAESVLQTIEQEGLDDHFKPFMRSFIRIMFNLFFTPKQYETACAHLDDGLHFSFLMSDAGGPSLSGWKTVAKQEGEGSHLYLDKVWGIEAHRIGVAVVAARQQGGFFPTAYLVWPDSYSTLQRTACGQPFLNGRLQLGNVKGNVFVRNEDRLKIGGPVVFNKYLTVVRPFFVRALMAHVSWLHKVGALKLEDEDNVIHAFISESAKSLTHIQRYDIEKVNNVMALKFLSNEFLVSLVRKKAVRDFRIQRDLLAFSKMEGSSYHCFKTLRASI